LLFAEGQPLDDIRETLIGLGFKEGRVEPLGIHFHHYRRPAERFPGTAITVPDTRKYR